MSSGSGDREGTAAAGGGGGGPPVLPPPSPGNNSVASGLTAASGSVVSAAGTAAGTSASAAPSQTTTPLRNASGGQQQFTAATAAALAPAWPNLSSSGGGGGGVPSSPVARSGASGATAMPGTPLQQGTPLVAAASPGAGAPYASPGPAAAAAASGGGAAVNASTTPMRAPQNTAAAAAAAAMSSPGNASQPQQPPSQLQPQTIGPPPPTPVQPHPGAPPPLVPSLSTQTSASAASTEQGVALGVEALERQQALVEQRRASAAAVVRQRQAQFQAQQQQQQQQLQVQQARNQQQQQARHPQAPPSMPTGAGGASSGMPPSYPVPRYPAGTGTGTDDDTAPSSVSGGGGGAGGGSVAAARPRSGGHSGGGGGGSGSGSVRRSGSFAKLLTPLKRLSSTGPEGKEGKTPSSVAGTELMSPPPGQPQQSRQQQRNNPAGDDNDDDEDPEEGMWADHEVKPLVYGYLHKLGRNGQWQKRFFETDGECLTYYKTRKRTKLLASLDLLKVGDIRCDEEDPEGCVFAIQVSDRPYYLRAETKAACKDWVINLNRVREARLEIGGIQLVQPHFSHEYNEIEVVDGGSAGGGGGGGDRNRSESDEYAARVVMIANRNRTRAIATTETEESLKKMIQNQRASSVDFGGASAADLLDAPPSPGKSGTEGGLSLPHSPGGRVLADHLPPVVLARWQKRRSNFQRLRYRLTQWARKINVMACTVIPHHDVSHEYTPDTANFDADRVSGAGAAVRGTAKLSDIDEHSREQDVHQIDSAISSGGESGGDYDEEPRELS